MKPETIVADPFAARRSPANLACDVLLCTGLCGDDLLMKRGTHL